MYHTTRRLAQTYRSTGIWVVPLHIDAQATTTLNSVAGIIDSLDWTAIGDGRPGKAAAGARAWQTSADYLHVSESQSLYMLLLVLRSGTLRRPIVGANSWNLFHLVTYLLGGRGEEGGGRRGRPAAVCL